MEPRDFCHEIFAALSPLCGVVSPAIDASEFDALPQGRDFVGPYVPCLHEPVEFDSVGGDRQHARQCVLASD